VSIQIPLATTMNYMDHVPFPSYRERIGGLGTVTRMSQQSKPT